MSANASHSATEMSASASESSNSIAPKATAVMAEMESEDETRETKTYVSSKAELQTGLKHWFKTSKTNLYAAESEREYKHPGPLQWDCILCSDPINSTPVYQCQTGHLVCYPCSQEDINCRSCSKAVNRIRNLAVEEMIESLVVTCKFAKLGCNKVRKLTELDYPKHEDNCSFSPMFCPMPGCFRAGVKNLFSQHLLSEHGISSLVDVGELRYSYGDHLPHYSQGSKEFVLDSSIALVMLRNRHFKEFHLLHHQCTAEEDRVEITSLAKTCKRKYELVVKVGDDFPVYYNSLTRSNIQPIGGLRITKQSDGSTLKKRCVVTMPE